MMLLELFLTFFKIGSVSFGGGYAMISVIRDEMLSRGWLTDGELINMIAVAESTPGPIAVNMATFVGARYGGVIGAFLATLGVVLPSFIIILIIAAVLKSFHKYKGVQAFLSGVRPCIVGLIISTAVTMGLSALLAFKKIGDYAAFDIKGFVILAILAAMPCLFKRLGRKKPSPIMIIVVSAVFGMILYAV